MTRVHILRQVIYVAVSDVGQWGKNQTQVEVSVTFDEDNTTHVLPATLLGGGTQLGCASAHCWTQPSSAVLGLLVSRRPWDLGARNCFWGPRKSPMRFCYAEYVLGPR